jgi:acylphosphatase
MISRRCLVSGRVQGVFFRAQTRHKALSLGLSGRAVNLPDGRVEVIVSGPAERVAALCEWLWEGPPMARVEGVDCETLPSPSAMSGFQVG